MSAIQPPRHTISKQATLGWAMLITAASKRETLTYSELAQGIRMDVLVIRDHGMDPDGVLRQIAEDCLGHCVEDGLPDWHDEQPDLTNLLRDKEPRKEHPTEPGDPYGCDHVSIGLLKRLVDNNIRPEEAGIDEGEAKRRALDYVAYDTKRLWDLWGEPCRPTN